VFLNANPCFRQYQRDSLVAQATLSQAFSETLYRGSAQAFEVQSHPVTDGLIPSPAPLQPFTHGPHKVSFLASLPAARR